MARTLSLETAFGLTCAEAHAVIKEFSMEKKVAENGTKTFVITYRGLIYMDVSKYTGDKSPITGFNYQFLLDITDGADQENLLKQCYLNLKTQDVFIDGVDA